MNKLFFYISIPTSIVATIIGVGLTFAFLPNFLENQKFEKIYNMEKGKSDSNSILQGEYNVIFGSNKSMNQSLDEYNNTNNKKEFLNNKLSLVFNKDTINMDTLSQEIQKLNALSQEQIKSWEEYKRQNIISNNYFWNLFQTKNYFTLLNSITFISTNHTGFIFGLVLFVPSIIGFIGLISFYYTSRKHGLTSDMEYDGIITSKEKEEFDNGIENQTFDRSKAIDAISNSDEMKKYLEKNSRLGFQNPLLQPKEKLNNDKIKYSSSQKEHLKSDVIRPKSPISEQKVNLENNQDLNKSKSFIFYKKINQKNKTKKISLNFIKQVNQKNKINLKKEKKLSRRKIDKILQGD